MQLLKTPRNILVANIALSGLLLCVFTMPLSVLDMIHNYWPLGSGQVWQTKTFEETIILDSFNQEILCKINSSSQTACVFFYSYSVALITVDRLWELSLTLIINPLLRLSKSRQTMTDIKCVIRFLISNSFSGFCSLFFLLFHRFHLTRWVSS